ncbi:MAG: chromate resistance protein ChrB domain-containing protein [Candidatus Binataceae bacterium]
MAESGQNRWLLLIHQIPPKPDYFRVKIWRRLQSLGAVAIKNSVYVLPRSDQTQEDLEWILREIVEGGGQASICEARFVEGLSDDQVQALLDAARDADYAQLVEEARRIGDELSAAGLDTERRNQLDAEAARLRRRFSETAAIDFFGAPGREVADGMLVGLETRLREFGKQPVRGGAREPVKLARGNTWVTRKGIHVDRMASAWLIRHFIDPDASFKFVPAKGYRPGPRELRFDMFEAEFTHDGDRCTFEVLLLRSGLHDSALRAMSEIVHDIDLKDAKFGRPEVAGIDHVITGIATAHKDDDTRLARGEALFSDLYAYFKRPTR